MFAKVPAFLDYLLHRQAHCEHDLAVDRELRFTPSTDHWPAGLGLCWLGTSGFHFSYQGYHLLIDPYVTRLSIRDLLLRRVVPPSQERIDQFIPAADAIVIGHTHFDHAMDAPIIAKKYQCPVYGSPSMSHLMGLYGLTDLAREVENYREYELGPFRVSFVPSQHSKLYLGLSVPYSGDLCCEHFDELSANAYKCGNVYGIHIEVAGTSFYHQGSADLIDDAIVHKGVDHFLAGISGRGFTKNYADRILRRLSPKMIIPTHYDNFFRPIDAPMQLSTNVNLAGFIEEVSEVSKEFQVRTLVPLQPMESNT